MARKYHYPTRVDLQIPWHANYAEQVMIHGVAIGLVLADVTASANDSKHMGYAIGAWRESAKNFGRGATGQVETLRYGTGGSPFELPEFLPPPPPAGLTPVLPGALTRIFKFVKMIKSAPGYTEGIGLLMGLVGEELPLPPPPGESPAPELTLKIIAGTLNQYVNVKYYKRSHEYVVIESRRGTGDWEQIAQSKKSPYIDNRNLLVAGQAEVREYRARFWDNGEPTSDWCDIARITVGPRDCFAGDVLRTESASREILSAKSQRLVSQSLRAQRASRRSRSPRLRAPHGSALCTSPVSQHPLLRVLGHGDEDFDDLVVFVVHGGLRFFGQILAPHGKAKPRLGLGSLRLIRSRLTLGSPSGLRCAQSISQPARLLGSASLSLLMKAAS